MPKTVDHDAQRERLADAAISAIGEHGLDRVRLVDVAKAAGATTGTLTHYFDGKDALLEAALGRVADRILEGVTWLEDTDADLLALVGMTLPLGESERRDWRVWLSYWGRAITSRELRDVHNGYYDQLRERLSASIAEGQARGAMSARHAPGVVADAIITAVDGLGVRGTLDPEDWPPKRQQELLETMLRPLLDPEAQKDAPDDAPKDAQRPPARRKT
ncbi:MAG: TetR/AcrR family transcriptional regulator [Myxococcota bacterium]|nr:TetR/AcrR family transcriptional regulator [Myxococcota bacterium]